MVKYTRFQDIPLFIIDGSWECDFEIQYLHEWIKRHKEQYGSELNLSPNFQRAHVWTEQQQISWLEFFLRGGKTGRVIYLNKPDWQGIRKYKKGQYNDFVVVDGKQRIEATRRFLDNEIQV